MKTGRLVNVLLKLVVIDTVIWPLRRYLLHAKNFGSVGSVRMISKRVRILIYHTGKVRKPSLYLTAFN